MSYAVVASPAVVFCVPSKKDPSQPRHRRQRTTPGRQGRVSARARVGGEGGGGGTVGDINWSRRAVGGGGGGLAAVGGLRREDRPSRASGVTRNDNVHQMRGDDVRRRSSAGNNQGEADPSGDNQAVTAAADDEAEQGPVSRDVGGQVDGKGAADNEAKWDLIVKLAYVAVSALIVANLVAGIFPAVAGSPPPPLRQWGEMCVMASGVLLGSLNFGPQAGKQVRGGLKALDQIGGTRAAAVDFLGLVILKMLFDLLGLAALAVPAVYLPRWLPRTVGIGVTMLAHGSFVSRCKTTFNADGSTKAVPSKVRELIANADRTLAFLALAVAAGTACNVPIVAVPAGGLFLAGAVYFTFEDQKARPVPKKTQ